MFVNFSVFYSRTCKAVEWDGMPHYKFPLILQPVGGGIHSFSAFLYPQF